MGHMQGGDACSNCHRIIQALFSGAAPSFLEGQPDRVLCPTCCRHEEIYGVPWPRRKPLPTPGDGGGSLDAAGGGTDGTPSPSTSAQPRREAVARPAQAQAPSRALAADAPPRPSARGRDSASAAPQTEVADAGASGHASTPAPRVPASAAVTHIANFATARQLVLVATGGWSGSSWRPAMVRRRAGEGVMWVDQKPDRGLGVRGCMGLGCAYRRCRLRSRTARCRRPPPRAHTAVTTALSATSTTTASTSSPPATH